MAKRTQPANRTSASIRATELCKKYPDTSTRTLAHKLYGEFKMHYANLESARSAIRSIRGAQGSKSNRNPAESVPWKKRKPGEKPKCPDSAVTPWLPVQIDRPAKVLILSDIHIPYHDKQAVEAAVSYGKKRKPDVVLLNGDIGDFYRHSRWTKDPRKRSGTQDLSDVKAFLVWLRHTFPTQQIIYKMGNHDEWFDKWVWEKCLELYDAEFLQLHNVLGFEDLGIERVDDNPVMCGKLPVLHGHEIGKGIFSPVNPARGAFLRTNHTVLIGHLHRSSSHAESNLWHAETMTWSQGALCGLTPEYARVNRWNHGFAFIEVDGGGEFDVNNYRLSEDYKVRTA